LTLEKKFQEFLGCVGLETLDRVMAVMELEKEEEAAECRSRRKKDLGSNGASKSRRASG